MKQISLLFLLSILSISCNRENGVKTISPNDVILNDVIHDSLSKEQLNKIKVIHNTFSEVLPSTLEETITNFKRDVNPDSEIEIWLKMSRVYNDYNESHNINLDEKKEVFKLILSRSMMDNENTLKNVDLKILTKKQATEVLNYYKDTPKPIKIEQK